ncbi:hypothetical protein COCOBI_04-5110 [Coccomyxa sp. Obi]|nr:hypothetical protein COCOBI_04-5110 [Coccomyxa sp. Obi]
MQQLPGALTERTCSCRSLLAHVTLAITIAGSMLFCSQAFAQLNTAQQLFAVLNLSPVLDSWKVVYKAVVITATATGPVLALLSSVLLRISGTCKAEAKSKQHGAGNLLLQRSTSIVARILSVLLFMFSAWLVMLGTLEAIGIVFTLDNRSRAHHVSMDSAEAQLCFDTIFFQDHVHICNPATIQQISDALDALFIFTSLTAGGLLLVWLGSQIFMCLSCEVAAVTSVAVRKALYTAEEEANVLNCMELQTPAHVGKVSPDKGTGTFPAASAPSWPPQH